MLSRLLYESGQVRLSPLAPVPVRSNRSSLLQSGKEFGWLGFDDLPIPTILQEILRQTLAALVPEREITTRAHLVWRREWRTQVLGKDLPAMEQAFEDYPTTDHRNPSSDEARGLNWYDNSGVTAAIWA